MYSNLTDAELYRLLADEPENINALREASWRWRDLYQRGATELA